MTGDTLLTVDARAEVNEAAGWLPSRHPWVDWLARRISVSGDSGDRDGVHDWAGGDRLDELAGAVNDCADHAAVWRPYEARHR
jgi:hypothetical protein